MWLIKLYAKICLGISLLLHGTIGMSAELDAIAVTEVSRGGVLVVPVTIKDKEYQFMLDSGSSYHIIDSTLKSHLGPYVGKSRTSSNETVATVEWYRPPAVAVRGISLNWKDNRALVIDLEGVRKATGVDIRGIIGISFFLDRIIRINCSSQRIDILPRMAANVEWGDRVAVITDEQGRPIIECSGPRYDGKQKYLVDTGDNGEIQLSAHAFDHCVRQNDIVLFAEHFTTNIAGGGRGQNGRLKSFQCGEFAHNDVLVERGRSNVVGMRYLKRYVVTFDLSDGAIYLKKGVAFAEIHEADMSGLHLLTEGGAIVVHSVDHGSPADLAGMRAGDVLQKIDGDTVIGSMLESIRGALRSSNDRRMVLEVARTNMHVTVPLVLRRQPWDVKQR